MKKLGRAPIPPVVKAELSVGRRSNLEKWGLAKISSDIFSPPLITIIIMTIAMIMMMALTAMIMFNKFFIVTA